VSGFHPTNTRLIRTKGAEDIWTQRRAITLGYRKMYSEELYKAYTIYSIKRKPKVHPTTGQEGPEGSTGVVLLFL
jgi:hypothetical protein